MRTAISTIMLLLLVGVSVASAQGMMGGGVGYNAGPGMMGNVQVTAEEINKSKQEEKEGQEFREYKKKVPAFIPRFKRGER